MADRALQLFADQSPIPMTEGASDGNPFAFIVNA